MSLLIALFAMPASAAELTRTYHLTHGGEFSSYGVYGFDYGSLSTGTFGNACVARVEPGVMYAVSDQLFIGAAVQSDYTTQSTLLTQRSVYSLGLAPKLRYALQFTETLSATPELTVGYRNGWQNLANSDLVDRATTKSQVWATFYLPVVIAPMRLSRGGLRPVLQWDVSSSLRLNNGGTLGGGPGFGGRGDTEISCLSTLGIRF